MQRQVNRRWWLIKGRPSKHESSLALDFAGGLFLGPLARTPPFWLSPTLERLRNWALRFPVNECGPSNHGGGVKVYLGKVDAERVHIQAVEKTGKAFAEPGEALVHELVMHHVGLEIRHGIGQLGERRLESVEGEARITVSALSGRLSKR